MIRKAVFLLLLCTVLTSAYSQRVLSKSIPLKHGQNIHIDADLAFEVYLSSANSYMVSATASTEGEYENDILLNLREEGTDIFIGIGFHPEHRKPNDKLSAHKVFSVSLDITVPESCKVTINGLNARFGISGQYQKLRVGLREGKCILGGVYGDVDVKTDSADIILNTSQGVARAASEYGEIIQEELPLGPAAYELNTKSGNVYIYRVR